MILGFEDEFKVRKEIEASFMDISQQCKRIKDPA